MSGAAALLSRDVEPVVLDTDGVITDSARARAAAWKTAFGVALRAPPSDDADARRPSDIQDDHLRFVDAGSRPDGAASFLDSRDPAAHVLRECCACSVDLAELLTEGPGD
ncbi:hypothetical protein [Streptomyces sp. NPDC058572]|uniref:hypothetical protein n=1 Tax=Streptomyces sp. NPDC058572 TaxID=3346546 RepID=UPI003646A674